jgi:divalent metal cation (Fe/Co/Zn/Cd) transporter
MKGGLEAPLLSAAIRSRMMRELIARLVAYLAALVLFATAFGFLVATLYLALAEVVEVPLAALLTSLALAGVAGLVLLSVRYRRPRKTAANTVGADALLLSLTEQVRRDPWLSLALAAMLGALTEISQSSSNRPPS